MTTKTSLALLALAVSAVPLAAQISTTDRVRDRVIVATGGRADTRMDTLRTGADGRTRSKIPPGHLPPRGMCRVWIDGVAPGQQPAITDCATAERNRTANSRVIYGDREAFRGRANGKFKNREQARECQVRDAVVIDGRVRNVCSDDNARRDRAGKGRRDVDDDGDDDDDRRLKADKASKKAEKLARKTAKKNDRGRD